MTVRREFAVYCDAKGCHRSVTIMDASEKRARTVARKWGWRYDKKRGKDHCPDHPPASSVGTQTQTVRS